MGFLAESQTPGYKLLSMCLGLESGLQNQTGPGSALLLSSYMTLRQLLNLPKDQLPSPENGV